MKEWVVVEFAETKECKAIPSSWLSESKEECFFPPSSLPEREVRFYIKSCVAAKKEWPQYQVRHFAQSITGEFIKAVELEKDAVDTSDVDAHRPLGRGYRKRKAAIIDSDEERFTKKTPGRIRRNFSDSDDSSPERCERRISTMTPPVFSPSQRASPSPPASCLKTEEGGTTRREVISEDFLQYLTRIEKTQLEILKEIRALKRAKPNCQMPDERDNELLLSWKFPMDTMEEFDALEVELLKKPFHAALTVELCRRGGNNITEGVFGMLYYLFTNNLGRRFSFFGHSKMSTKKIQFSATRTCACIIDAFGCKPTLKEYGYKDIKDKAIDWFRHAESRHKRGEERKKNCK
ncbi:uncharacterized protein LOC124167200 [Ischnura elegans]|uniref:uncharacterized protein LOC124167200 n=1 Tax=Ischnura elegans TaxID=197161 RepID=UPI001ED8A64F|nr:uncharacterized protein LOC124167200 [Ischnura elegans]